MNIVLNKQRKYIITKQVALQLHSQNVAVGEIKLPDDVKNLEQLISKYGIEKSISCIKEVKQIDTHTLHNEQESKLDKKFQKEYGGYETGIWQVKAIYSEMCTKITYDVLIFYKIC